MFLIVSPISVSSFSIVLYVPVSIPLCQIHHDTGDTETFYSYNRPNYVSIIPILFKIPRSTLNTVSFNRLFLTRNSADVDTKLILCFGNKSPLPKKSRMSLLDYERSVVLYV